MSFVFLTAVDCVENSTVCTHRQETVSSTLVAGIAAVKGSASPIHAIFIELLLGRSQIAPYPAP